jgi:hypothetical protein
VPYCTDTVVSCAFGSTVAETVPVLGDTALAAAPVSSGGATWWAPRSQPVDGRIAPRSSTTGQAVPAASAGLPEPSAFVSIPGPPLNCSGPSSGSAVMGMPMIFPAFNCCCERTIFGPGSVTVAELMLGTVGP